MSLLFSIQSLLSLFAFFIIICYLYFSNNNNNNNNKSKSTKSTTTSTSSPILRNYPLLGTLPQFIQNRHRFLDWATEILASSPTNTLTFCRPGGIRGVSTANPLVIEYILKTNFRNYPKGPRFTSYLHDFLGQGIFNSDSHLWKLQRKTASFEFNTKSLRNFAADNVEFELQSRLLPLLHNSSHTPTPIDLQDLLERFAFDNVCKLAFNVDPKCLSLSSQHSEKNHSVVGAEFMQAFEDAAMLSAGRFMYAVPNLWRLKKRFNIGSENRLRESIKTVHDFADRIIRSRLVGRDGSGLGSDLLSRFITNGHDSPEFLRDIVISFILAGRDTTSSALSWFFWVLASRPDVERSILEELEGVRVRYGKCVRDAYSLEELREMNYLHAAITESMRLYPPVPMDEKESLEEDVLPDGTFVGKGWFVSYNTYATGRMESVWGKDCMVFVPERWLENGMFRAENAFQYPIFHAGPRICLGKDMAYIQMKAIAASVIERFVVEIVEKDKPPTPLLSLTLRMKEGLMVRVKKRC
ncbi:hypothetical protein Scep_003168 [Stephania cephalantha]|uniref:Cytochrome P450 n=1 Tax=Stephania cephalantha TaxID=152367 RepID=A0AAP0PW34_9MAGN